MVSLIIEIAASMSRSIHVIAAELVAALHSAIWFIANHFLS